jgi:hypothetical protein
MAAKSHIVADFRANDSLIQVQSGRVFRHIGVLGEMGG